MYRTINMLSFGEHRGGMFVAVEGAGRDGARSNARGIFWPRPTTAR